MKTQTPFWFYALRKKLTLLILLSVVFTLSLYPSYRIIIGFPLEKPAIAIVMAAMSLWVTVLFLLYLIKFAHNEHNRRMNI